MSSSNPLRTKSVTLSSNNWNFTSNRKWSFFVVVITMSVWCFFTIVNRVECQIFYDLGNIVSIWIFRCRTPVERDKNSGKQKKVKIASIVVSKPQMSTRNTDLINIKLKLEHVTQTSSLLLFLLSWAWKNVQNLHNFED